MSDIVLKDDTGENITYENVSSVTFNTADGDTVTYSENIQVDYEQSFETEPDYIKNRPFYSFYEYGNIISEDVSYFMSNNTKNESVINLEGYFTGNIDFKLEVGKLYAFQIEDKIIAGIAEEWYNCENYLYILVGSSRAKNLCKKKIDGESYSLTKDDLVNYNSAVLVYNESSNDFSIKSFEKGTETITNGDRKTIHSAILNLEHKYEASFKKIDSKYLPNYRNNHDTHYIIYRYFESLSSLPSITLPDSTFYWNTLYKISDDVLPWRINDLDGKYFVNLEYDKNGGYLSYDYDFDLSKITLMYAVTTTYGMDIADPNAYIVHFYTDGHIEDYDYTEFELLNVRASGNYNFINMRNEKIDIGYIEAGIYIIFNNSGVTSFNIIISKEISEQISKNYLPDIDLDYSDIKNKPFGEMNKSYTLEKDIDEIVRDPDYINAGVIKVSNDIINISDIIGCKIIDKDYNEITNSETESTFYPPTISSTDSYIVDESMIEPIDDNNSGYLISNGIMIITADEFIDNDYTLSRGIYFIPQFEVISNDPSNSYSFPSVIESYYYCVSSIIMPDKCIKKIDSKYINATWDDLENRPFYKIVQTQEMMALQNIECTSSGDIGGVGYIGEIPANVFSEEGDICTVVYDDITYECVAYNLEGALAIGDFENFTDPPFVIVSDTIGMVTGSPALIIMTADESTEGVTYTHSIQITVQKTDIKKIEKEFMPDGIPWVSCETVDVMYEVSKIDEYEAIAIGASETLYKVSDEGIPYSTLIGSYVTMNGAPMIEVTEDNCDINTLKGSTYYSVMNLVWIVNEEIFVSDGQITIPVGVYVTSDVKSALTSQGYISFGIRYENVTPIDEKYIPKVEELPEVSTSDNDKVLKVIEGKWTVSNETQELPEVSTSDNGKMLQVVNGKWTAVSITNGNEVAY